MKPSNLLSVTNGEKLTSDPQSQSSSSSMTPLPHVPKRPISDGLQIKVFVATLVLVPVKTNNDPSFIVSEWEGRQESWELTYSKDTMPTLVPSTVEIV